MWEACGRLGLPVAMHVGDPEAFFLPIDRFNERYEELNAHPDWSFLRQGLSRLQEILDAATGSSPGIRRPPSWRCTSATGPRTSGVGEMLDSSPTSTSKSARASASSAASRERRARFFDKYQDRILFGTDAIPTGTETPQQVFGEDLYQIYYRFLETEDEYFDYAPVARPTAGPLADLRPRPAGADPPQGLSPECRARARVEARRSVKLPTIHLLVVLTLLTLLATATQPPPAGKPRARDLGISAMIGGTPGTLDAITDVAGVEVGHTTLIAGSGKLVVGKGPVRTGVTVIHPRGKANADPVIGAWFTLNGNGEMTGTTWLQESGFLEGPSRSRTRTPSASCATRFSSGRSRAPACSRGGCRWSPRRLTVRSTTSTAST